MADNRYSVVESVKEMSPVVIDSVALEPRSELHRRKLEALKAFIGQLRRRGRRDGIVKVLLIGSVLKGNVSAESDIDLVVFGTGDLQAVRMLCAEAAFEAGLDTGESVQPVVYPLNSYYHPTTSFLKRAINEGRTIYSMNNTDLKRDLLDGKHRLASSYLRVAQYVFDNGDYREAADLGYNAAETAVKALLLLKMDNLPKTHGGIIKRFGDLYVQTCKLSHTLVQDLYSALETRIRAGYEEKSVITREDAKEVLTLADQLLQHVVQFRDALSEADEEIDDDI